MSTDDTSTNPTIETLLDRQNAMESRLLIEIRSGNEQVRKEQVQLRTDMNAGFRKVERKMEILNDVLLDIRSQLRDHEYRLESLESGSTRDEAGT
jgi:hypothetical protein